MPHPFRLLRTLAPQHPAQLANRLVRRLRSARPRPGPAPARAALDEGAAFLPRPPSLIADDRALLLDIAHATAWADPALPKLWRYNLHYMDGLRAPETPLARRTRLIDCWIAENPPPRGDGWEPYPLSLRAVNWMLFALDHGPLSAQAYDSLALQLRSLERQIEWHLMGNHLLANAKALVMGGLFFTGPEAERWRAAGWRILEPQLARQFLGDGGHEERSPSYHALLTEDLLDLINLGRRARYRPAEALVPTATRALAWLATMTRPDGCWPLFNDAAQEVAPDTGALIDYADALGIVQPPAPAPGLTSLSPSGYHRWTGPIYQAWIDAAALGPDHNPGHGHADVLTFELFAHGHPLIVDTGVSTYDAGQRRACERSTAAHNTVELGGRSQAELWGSFRVGRRPRVVDAVTTPTSLSAAHTGYAPAIHARAFTFAPDRLTIEDHIRRRRAAPDAVARLHFAPGVPVTLDRGAARAGPLAIRFVGAEEVRIEPCEIADGFNRRLPSLALAARFSDRLRTVIVP